jgi:hypothetical protein
MKNEEIFYRYDDFLIIRDKEYEYRGRFNGKTGNIYKIELCNKYKIGEIKDFYERVKGNPCVEFKEEDIVIERAQFENNYKVGDKIYVKYDSRSTTASKNLNKVLEVTAVRGSYVLTNHKNCGGVYNSEIVPYMKIESYSII